MDARASAEGSGTGGGIGGTAYSVEGAVVACTMGSAGVLEKPWFIEYGSTGCGGSEICSVASSLKMDRPLTASSTWVGASESSNPTGEEMRVTGSSSSTSGSTGARSAGDGSAGSGAAGSGSGSSGSGKGDSGEGSSSQTDLITPGSSGEGAEGTMTTTTRFTESSSSCSAGESAVPGGGSSGDISADRCPTGDNSVDAGACSRGDSSVDAGACSRGDSSVDAGACSRGDSSDDAGACSRGDTSADHCLTGTSSPGTGPAGVPGCMTETTRVTGSSTSKDSGELCVTGAGTSWSRWRASSPGNESSSSG